MIDIVDLLRVSTMDLRGAGEAMMRAADEIERLRDEAERLRLRVENDAIRLRAAADAGEF
jgi:hypothetical protein